jgi:hypothetical protein
VLNSRNIRCHTHRFPGAEMTLIKSPVARATMLIRRPVEEVFNAFVDPTVTTRFWFSRSSGQLAPGKTVTWYWDQYGVSGKLRSRRWRRTKELPLNGPRLLNGLLRLKAMTQHLFLSSPQASQEPMMKRLRRHWIPLKDSIS